MLALKRWLISTRTPLSAPVKCHSTSASTPKESSRRRQQQPGQSQNHQQASPPTSTKKRRINASPRLQDSPANGLPLSLDGSINSAHKSELIPGDDEDEIEEQEADYLDRSSPDGLVCAPQALVLSTSAHANEMSLETASTKIPTTDQPLRGQHLTAIYHYLESTLVNQPMSINPPSATADLAQQQQQHRSQLSVVKHKETVHVREGKQFLLKHNATV